MNKTRSGRKLATRQHKGMVELLKRAETLTNLTHMVGLKSIGSVSRWERVPVKYVLKLEKKTGISRHVLRPDIYGRAP